MNFVKKLNWFCAGLLVALPAYSQVDQPLGGKIELQHAALPTPTNDLRRDAVVEAVEHTMPSVVNVATEDIRPVRDPMQELLEQFWNPYYQRRAPDSPYSLGSGVIISDDGYLLTNDHVVQRANKIWVKLATGGNVFEAKLIATDPNKDLALLKILAPPGEKFTAITFAVEDDLLLGETVLALGNPFNLGGSVSRGILSSKNRLDAKGDEALNLYNCLQTDASINPGNSGGPLVNLRGELIGLNAVILEKAQGIGFAIPIKQINNALSGLITPETAKQLWFGARVKMSGGQLVVNSVQPGSPADKAGVQAGDVIAEVNKRAPHGFLDFNQTLITSPQREVALTLARSGVPHTALVRLVPESSFFNADLIRQKLGASLSLQPVSPQLAAQLRLSSANVFVVTDVDASSPAAASLQRGFLVTMIDGRAPADLTEAAKILYAKMKGDTARLEVVAQKQQGSITYTSHGALEIPVR